MDTKSSSPAHYDALVVGARCAGAATALLLARRGLRVLVVDRGEYGQDTLSTHAMMRGGVLQLHRWGVLDVIRSAGTPLITTTSFYYGDERLEVPIRASGGLDGLYGPRRTVLDAALVDAAREAGAEVRYGHRFVGLSRDRAGRVTGASLSDRSGAERRIAAAIVVGADGLRSRVATTAGAEIRRTGRNASAFLYGYFPGLGNDGYRWYYRPGLSAGAIPTNGGLTCIFVSSPSRARVREHGERRLAGYRDQLARVAPGLATAVASRMPVGPLFEFPGTPSFQRQAAGPGWALVGDAGYFRDPITAHGITDALRDAELLARAIVGGGEPAMRAYEAERDELSGRFFEITDSIAGYDWSLDEVRELHRAASEEMKREVRLLSGLVEEPRADAWAGAPVIPSGPPTTRP